jgi:EpsI family protein
MLSTVHNGMSRSEWWPFVPIAGLLIATLVMARDTRFRQVDPLAVPLAAIPARVDGWDAAGDEPLSEYVLEKLRPSSYLLRSYAKQGSRLGLFIAFYSAQRTGETTHSPKHCLPGSGWEILRRDALELPGGPMPVVVNRYSIQNADQKMTMLYWYQSRERVVANEFTAKLLLMRDALQDGRTGGALVRITVAEQPGSVEAVSLFAAEIVRAVSRCFGEPPVRS